MSKFKTLAFVLFFSITPATAMQERNGNSTISNLKSRIAKLATTTVKLQEESGPAINNSTDEMRKAILVPIQNELKTIQAKMKKAEEVIQKTETAIQAIETWAEETEALIKETETTLGKLTAAANKKSDEHGTEHDPSKDIRVATQELPATPWSSYLTGRTLAQAGGAVVALAVIGALCYYYAPPAGDATEDDDDQKNKGNRVAPEEGPAKQA